MKTYKTKSGWQYWFDANAGQVWYAAKFDENGNQIGDAINAHSRKQIKQAIGA